MTDLIYTYTRVQALSDEVLYDVTEMAKEAGFRVPVAVTASLQARLTPSKRDKEMCQSYEGRLWDVLYMAGRIAQKTSDGMFKYKVIIASYKGHQRNAPEYTLIAKIGPGDNGEAVITIGLPRDF